MDGARFFITSRAIFLVGRLQLESGRDRFFGFQLAVEVERDVGVAPALAPGDDESGDGSNERRNRSCAPHGFISKLPSDDGGKESERHAERDAGEDLTHREPAPNPSCPLRKLPIEALHLGSTLFLQLGV